MNRRRLLATAGALLGSGALAGCLDRTGAPGGSPSQSPAQSPDASEATPTGTGGHGGAPSRPDPDLAVMVENDDDVAHEVTLRVAREDRPVVHESSHEASPGTFREVYNLEAADPEGIEAFVVTATAGDQEADSRVETSECYGPVVVNVDEEGELYVGVVTC